MAERAIEEFTHGPHVEEPTALGLLPSSLELARAEQQREVEQGPGRGGDGDAVDHAPVGGGEPAGAMGPDASAVTVRRTGRGHVDRATGNRAQAPERRRAPVAQQRLTTARENRRHPAPAPAHGRVSDRVDTEVERVEPPACHPAVHRRRVEPKRGELPRGEHPVLPGGDLGDRCIDWSTSLSGSATEVDHVGHP